jgi:hypothetical protein
LCNRRELLPSRRGEVGWGIGHEIDQGTRGSNRIWPGDCGIAIPRVEYFDTAGANPRQLTIVAMSVVHTNSHSQVFFVAHSI